MFLISLLAVVSCELPCDHSLRANTQYDFLFRHCIQQQQQTDLNNRKDALLCQGKMSQLSKTLVMDSDIVMWKKFPNPHCRECQYYATTMLYSGNMFVLGGCEENEHTLRQKMTAILGVSKPSMKSTAIEVSTSFRKNLLLMSPVVRVS